MAALSLIMLRLLQQYKQALAQEVVLYLQKIQNIRICSEFKS